MKVTILDDYHDTLRTLDCFATLAGHDAELGAGVDVDAEALVLIRERTEIRAPLLHRLPG